MPTRLLLVTLLAFGCNSTKSDTGENGDDKPDFRPPPLATELPPGTLHRTSRATDFGSMLEDIAKADIVYVGEDHENAHHHALQLKVVEYLWDRKRLHAVGLEMVERKAQPALTAYVEKRIGEDELLARTEWKDRWGYDFALYREIFEFARSKRIPLIALNVERETRRKVSEGGLDSLTPADRLNLPAIDTSDAEHRAFVRAAFGNEHTSNFDRAYEVMCLWDDVMADTIVAWFRTAPKNAQLVVLAGNGHVANRLGVPKRTHKRNGKPYQTIVTMGSGAPAAAYAKAHADFVWVTK